MAGDPPGASAHALADGPASSSTCNGSVCEYVQGSGTEVTDWETTAYAGSATCTYANFWVNYVLERQSSQQCVAAGTQLRSDWRNTSFPVGTVLCNTLVRHIRRPLRNYEGLTSQPQEARAKKGRKE